MDAVEVVTGECEFRNPETFEQGLGCWQVDGGTWEVGPVTSGPNRAYAGVRAAGTVLGGDYRNGVSSRLISAHFTVPSVETNPRLRFWHWYELAGGDTGRVQLREGAGNWVTLSPTYSGTSSGIWSSQLFDLAAYAGKRVQIAFWFQSTTTDAFNRDVGPGWYLDDVRIQAEVIDRIESRTVDEETLLVVPITVNGAVPMLRLAGDVPAGARMDPDLGIFTWIPTEEQGPGVHSITIEAVDPANSLTPLDFRTFTVTVSEVNRPPIVDPIPPQVLEANVPLTFEVTAFDPDRPVIQTLSFSLDQGAPPGATIHPQTGVFTWTPTPEQAGLEHSITVRVTDNGTPPLSATTTFLAVPAGSMGELKLSMRSGPQNSLLIDLEGATDGAEYIIETTAELKSPPEATQWTPLRTFRWEPGAAPETIPTGTEPMQFYRIVRQP